MKNKAFTLIELSIVLVIIGLIVGGVLVGQDLIKASQLRSLISDKERFETANNAFRLKYNCLAGDCAQAATFGLGENGSGDRRLEYPNSAVSGTDEIESWEYWKQLANAGLIEGSYTGVGIDDGSGNDWVAEVGSNVPGSRLGNGGWSVYPSWILGDGGSGGSTSQAHYLVFGQNLASDTVTTMGGLLTLSELYQIDQKYDDGVAISGIIRAWSSAFAQGIAGCTTGVAPNHVYASPLSDSVRCVMVIPYNPWN